MIVQRTFSALVAALAASSALAAEAGSAMSASAAARASAYWRQESASALVNRALQSDPRNPRLNYLNGLIYDAKSTPAAGRELARVGYEVALRNDPTFWPAAYQLGLLAMDNRDALLAERWLLTAAAYAPREAIVAYALARAAYCAGDYGTAAAALERALAISPPDSRDSYLTASLVKAATGDGAGASAWLSRYRGVADDVRYDEARDRTQELLTRVMYQAAPVPSGTAPAAPSAPSAPVGTVVYVLPGTAPPAPAVPPAPAGTVVYVMPGSAPPAAPAAPAAPPAPPKPLDLAQNRTAVIDVIFLRRDMSSSTGQGLNVLDLLNLNFAASLVNSATDKVRDRSTDTVTSNTGTNSRSVNIDVPAVKYSLNIANASGGLSTIEGHPSLLVYDGQSSSLFSGQTITYGVSGNLGGATFTKDIGLMLTVKPQFRNGGPVNLAVTATMETLFNGDLSSFSEEIATQKDSTIIVADLNFNQAMLVSGGSLYKKNYGRSQVPGLGSIPGFDMAFRRRSTTEQRTDLYVLMALRKADDDGSDVRTELRRQIDKLLENAGKSISSLDVANTGPSLVEPRAEFYQVENPGRRLDGAYITRLGFTPDILGTERISSSHR